MNICLSTSNVWKLYYIVEFLSKYSKDNVEYLLKNEFLYGYVFDSFSRIIIQTKFKFDCLNNYYEPFQFKFINPQLLLSRLNNLNRNSKCNFIFGQNNLTISSSFNERTVKHVISYNIKPLCLDDIKLELPSILNSFSIDTLTFAQICNDIKDSSNVEINGFHDKIEFVTEGVNESSTCLNLKSQTEKETKVKIKVGLLLPWKKTLKDISNLVFLNFSENNLTIQMDGDGNLIEMHYQTI
jgi:hypothetical protein